MNNKLQPRLPVTIRRVEAIEAEKLGVRVSSSGHDDKGAHHGLYESITLTGLIKQSPLKCQEADIVYKDVTNHQLNSAS